MKIAYPDDGHGYLCAKGSYFDDGHGYTCFEDRAPARSWEQRPGWKAKRYGTFKRPEPMETFFGKDLELLPAGSSLASSGPPPPLPHKIAKSPANWSSWGKPPPAVSFTGFWGSPSKQRIEFGNGAYGFRDLESNLYYNDGHGYSFYKHYDPGSCWEEGPGGKKRDYLFRTGRRNQYEYDPLGCDIYEQDDPEWIVSRGSTYGIVYIKDKMSKAIKDNQNSDGWETVSEGDDEEDDAEDNRDVNDNKDRKDEEDDNTKENRDVNDNKDWKDIKDNQGTKDANDVKDVEDAKDGENDWEDEDEDDENGDEDDEEDDEEDGEDDDTDSDRSSSGSQSNASEESISVGPRLEVRCSRCYARGHEAGADFCPWRWRSGKRKSSRKVTDSEAFFASIISRSPVRS